MVSIADVGFGVSQTLPVLSPCEPRIRGSSSISNSPRFTCIRGRRSQWRDS